MNPLHDLRHGLRSLRSRPLVPILVVILLAFGVGANIAIYSVAESTLLSQLPYPNADRLVAIWQDLENRQVENYPSAPADLVDFRELDAFDEVAGLFAFDHSIVDREGRAHKIRMAQVTDNLDETLGVRAELGRLFEPEDAVPVPRDAGSPPIAFRVVLSHQTWQARFGGDPGIVGSEIDFGAGPGQVVGVLPRGFRLVLNPETGWTEEIDVYLPYQIDWSEAPRSSWFLTTVALLADDTTLAEAQAQLAGVEASWWQDFPVNKNAGTRIRAVPLHEDVTGAIRPAILALAGTAFLLLLVAGVNVTSLVLVRSIARGHELSIRGALGGSRTSLLRKQLLEALVLALSGSALAVLLARVTVGWLFRLRPPELVALSPPTIDVRTLGLTLALSTLTVLLAAAWPAWRASRPDLLGALRGQVGRAPTPTVRRALSAMVVLQVAITMALLVGSVLMLRSVLSLQSEPLGFEPSGVLTFETSAPMSIYGEADARIALHERLQEELSALPGVASVGATSFLPLSGVGAQGPYGGERELADNDEGDLRQAYWRYVSPGYFETLGAPLLEGRVFVAADERSESPIAVVDREVSERSWPSSPAAGERLYVKSQQPPIWAEVVGVVGNQRQALPFGREQGTIYFPGLLSRPTVNWVVRGSGSSSALAKPVSELIGAIDPQITVADVEPLADIVERSHAPVRFTATLIGAFGALALTLASCGLFGVLSYNVAQQRNEFGIRVALGATRSRILWPVLSRAVALAAAGVALGALASVPTLRLIEDQLVGVSALDPTSYAAAGIGFLVVALLSALAPAMWAADGNPSEALRPE